MGLCAIIFFCLPVLVRAATPEPSTAPGSALDEVVAPYVEAGDFMGVVALQRDGEPPLVRAYGEAVVELGVPHEPSNVFMIGSISKQFTAVALLLLEEEGALAIEDPVSRFLPDFPNGEAITIHQLLTHTSGVADVYSLPRFGASAGRQGTFDQVVADLGSLAPTFAPGAGYAYSNGGYSLAAAIVERASGMGYGDFIERRLFGPLGMTASGHDAPGPVVAGRVPGYDPWGVDRLAPAVPVAPAYTIGSGSIWSSAEDLLRWSSALHGGQVLSTPSYARLIRDYGRGYGYGLSVFTRFGRPVLGHDGRVAGFASDLARYVDDEVTVVVLSNVQSVARDEIRRLAAAVFFGEEIEAQPVREFLATAPEPLERFAGVYAFAPTFKVTVAEDAGRLMARANQGGWSELVPLAGGGWFSRMLYATVRFGRDDAGAVDRLIWGSGGGAPVGLRE